MEQKNQTSQSGSHLGAAQLISAGRPRVDNEAWCFVLPGRGSTTSVRTWTGLHISRKWKVYSANVDGHEEPPIMIIEIDCRVKESEMDGRIVFSWEGG